MGANQEAVWLKRWFCNSIQLLSIIIYHFWIHFKTTVYDIHYLIYIWVAWSFRQQCLLLDMHQVLPNIYQNDIHFPTNWEKQVSSRHMHNCNTGSQPPGLQVETILWLRPIHNPKLDLWSASRSLPKVSWQRQGSGEGNEERLLTGIQIIPTDQMANWWSGLACTSQGGCRQNLAQCEWHASSWCCWKDGGTTTGVRGDTTKKNKGEKDWRLCATMIASSSYFSYGNSGMHIKIWVNFL